MRPVHDLAISAGIGQLRLKKNGIEILVGVAWKISVRYIVCPLRAQCIQFMPQVKVLVDIERLCLVAHQRLVSGNQLLLAYLIDF
jgi:hypothetical protein